MRRRTPTERPDFHLERLTGVVRICGVDEVGRGPWAGPLVAAAAILDPDQVPEGIRDSKMLTAKARTKLARELHAVAEVAVGLATVGEIDTLGLGRANALAMERAVAALPSAPDAVLVDGRSVPTGLPCPAWAVVKGDALSLSIAAASIVAKVTRDALMADLARLFPGYGWETNAGYGVARHREALLRLGVTPHHRRSFRPVAKIISEETSIEN